METTLSQPTQAIPQQSQPDLVFPSRPAVSKEFQGKSIKVATNHYAVALSDPKKMIYLYAVEYEPEVPSDHRKLAASLLREVTKEISAGVGDNWVMSGRVLFAIKDKKEALTFSSKADGTLYVIRLKPVGSTDMSKGVFQDNATSQAARQYLNVLVKKYMREHKYIEWGRNAKYYDTANIKELSQHYVNIFTGYKTSFEVYQGGVPKLLIDFSSRIVRMDSVLEYSKHFKITEDFLYDIVGRSVVAYYGNFRMYRVTAIDYKQTPLSKFKTEDGKEITFVDYYKKQYGIKINPNQPFLIVSENRKTQKKFLLIPELMRMTGLTDDMRADWKVMQDVARYTKKHPDERVYEQEKLAMPLSKDFTGKYGLKVTTDSTTVDAMLLRPPKLQLGKGQLQPQGGQYQLREPILKPMDLDKWLFVYISASKEDDQNAGYVVQTLQKASGAFGIKVREPTYIEVKEKSSKAFGDAIKKSMEKGTKIVVCLIPPPAKKAFYPLIKRVCCKELGIPSQVIVTTTLADPKKSMSAASKILLQINAKLGLELWITEKPKGLPERSMIIGADVFHNIGQKKDSCVGFCASLDPHFSKFYSKISLQKPGQEIMDNLSKMIQDAIRKYFEHNGKKFLPEYIFFYRDGVGEGQVPMVMTYEVPQILAGFKSIGENYKPKFAEIVVTKRINDRIYAFGDSSGSRGSSSQGGRGGYPKEREAQYNNPLSGTIVAQSIVSNKGFDFFVCAQNVTQGTCTPTHYNVIHDSTGLAQDVFWELTFFQCFNYFNWNGAVRVPAPAQYAHKLGFLVGQTFKDVPHPNLDDKLYYL
jgi:aubergine-like protein